MNDEGPRRFYSYRGDAYYVLVRSTGIIMVEAPEDNNGKESVLRLFVSVAEAARYRDSEVGRNVAIRSVTLVHLWSLLERINSLSLAQFKAPVSIVVSGFTDEGPVSYSVLHSVYNEKC